MKDINKYIEEAKGEFDRDFCIQAGDPPQVFGLGDWIDEFSLKDFLREKMEQAYALGMDAGAESAVEKIRDRFHHTEYVKRGTLIDFLEAARTAHKEKV